MDTEAINKTTENNDDNIVRDKQVTTVAESKPLEVNIENKEVQKSGYKYHVFITGLLLIIISIAGYWAFNQIDKRDSSCMYWTGYCYEAVSCNQQISNALIIPADTLKLHYFKKINRPDTISTKSLGHIWYSKINNEVGFFTAEGHHPVQLEYQLKPLTKYMIEKYTAKNEVSQ